MRVDLDAFYSEETIDEWKQIIGDDLHYHFGYSTGKEHIESALCQTIRNFYPYIPVGSRVLNIGCYWGGLGMMLVNERQCHVQGVAFSTTQAKYCQSIGLDAWQSDIETMSIEGKYDVVLMHEIFSHIHDKQALLTRLRPVAPRLIVTMNCLPDHIATPQIAFDGTMVMITQSEFVALIEQTGWRIVFKRNRRFQSLATILYWKKNLDRVYGERTPPGQLGVLKNMAETALRSPARWCQMNPLIDIVAEVAE